MRLDSFYFRGIHAFPSQAALSSVPVKGAAVSTVQRNPSDDGFEKFSRPQGQDIVVGGSCALAILGGGALLALKRAFQRSERRNAILGILSHAGGPLRGEHVQAQLLSLIKGQVVTFGMVADDLEQLANKGLVFRNMAGYYQVNPSRPYV